ncbi:MAG: hypothetical protein AAGF45_00385 [Pseudomonadota bacterium]
MGALVCVAVLAGCVAEPGAALIPLPERPATVLQSEAPEATPDGFANVLADPATVAGLPRTPKEIAAQERALAHEGAATAALARGIPTTSNAAALAAEARNAVARTRARIRAQARNGAPGEPVRTTVGDASVPAEPAPAQPVDPGRPIDPSEPLPRAVGVPPFTGVAPGASEE